MASSRFQHTVSFETSGSHEQPRPDVYDTVHRGSGPHCSLPPYQYQEDSFNQALYFEALVSQFPVTLPYNPPLWNTQVDGLPTLDYELPPFSNNYLASPTSSITPPPFPTTPPSLPNPDQFSLEPFQGFTTPAGDSLSQENIHQEQPLVYVPFSNTWGENYLVGQIVTLRDHAHRYTSCSEPPSPESHLSEDMSLLVSGEMVTSHLDTPPVGSKRTRTLSDLSDEPQSKRIRRDPNAPIDGSAPSPLTETGVIPHPQPSLPPTEEVEPIREFKRGNRCGHNGCGKWHTDPSAISRHRRAHVDRYPCPNPNCTLIATTYRALKRHWANPRGGCSAYEQKREVCLVRGQANVERFDPRIHRPYKSLKLRRGKHAN